MSTLPGPAQAAAVVAVSVVVLLLGQGAAVASCAVEPGPAGSPVVVVGTPTESRRGFTRLEVSEVWRGPDLAEQVWVLSGQEQPAWPISLFQGVSSSTDADLQHGTAYIVGASMDFITNDCVVRAAGSKAELQKQRPADIRKPTVDGLTGADPPPPAWAPWAVTAAGVSTVWIAAGTLLRRWRS
ncbi:hypothetical protein BH20ACT6_BH20ACT6_20580 [soil metagenome]